MPFNAHAVRHNDYQLISARCRNGGKTDARIAGGGFDYHGVLIKHAAFFGIVYHCQRNAVFDRTGGVEKLKLGYEPRLQAKLFFYMRKLNKRGIAYKLFC